MRNLIAISLLAIATPAFAESETKVSAGVSPALVALKGFGIEADVMPAPHLRVFAAAFTLAIPKLFQRENSDEGWTIRDTGGGIGGEYFLRDDGRGFFFGAILEAQNHNDRRMGLSQNSLEIGVAAEAGYRWMATDHIYVTPRVLLVAPIYKTKERTLGGESVDEGPVRVVPLLYTGWQF
jgi:hypothetical protein